MSTTHELRTTPWSSEDPADAFDVLNPATGAVIATVQGGGVAEVDAAVEMANRAFAVWRLRSPRERSLVLARIAAIIREHADELAGLESEEIGKPRAAARAFDLEACAGIFEFYAGLVDKSPGEYHEQGPVNSTVLREPHGVVGGVIPFNWPPIHFAGKVAPALAMGNTVVLKPGEQGPLTIMRLAELLAGELPEGALSVVPGGAAAGEALVSHPLVRHVSFTGASATGAMVARQVADNFTPLMLELGGKNPFVVFADADLDAAAAAAFEGAFFNQGEACTAASRILVERSVHDAFVARLVGPVANLRVGDPSDPATHMGPLVDARQRERVLEHLETAEREGATVAARGSIPDAPELADGFWVAPTLLTGVTPDMAAAREEIFGPVTCVIPFDTYEEAIAIANGTAYGLIAAVFTADAIKGWNAARDIDAGGVFINNYVRQGLGIPFGGTKASGYGREHGLETLAEYSKAKTIRVPSGRGPLPQWPAATELFSDTDQN